MRKAQAAGLGILLLAIGCVAPTPLVIAPPELLNFYKNADAYGASATSRVCADGSLKPRVEEMTRRLAAVREVLVSRYGAAQVEAARVAVVADTADLCSNKTAAANAVNGFESAVSNLESALQ